MQGAGGSEPPGKLGGGWRASRPPSKRRCSLPATLTPPGGLLSALALRSQRGAVGGRRLGAPVQLRLQGVSLSIQRSHHAAQLCHLALAALGE